MGSNWNSHEYASRTRKARREYRCDACKGIIRKGELYDSTYGGIGHEHHDICPQTEPAEAADAGRR